jgi:hypothetical protein
MVTLPSAARELSLSAQAPDREEAGMFPFGQVAATPGALDALAVAGVSATALLARHAAGDWGDVPPEDAAENELSPARGFRIVSSYPAGDDPVWVITEADRSATTLLLPSEY